MSRCQEEIGQVMNTRRAFRYAALRVWVAQALIPFRLGTALPSGTAAICSEVEWDAAFLKGEV